MLTKQKPDEKKKQRQMKKKKVTKQKPRFLYLLTVSRYLFGALEKLGLFRGLFRTLSNT